MKHRFWLFKRGDTYYVQDAVTRKKESLQTTDKHVAMRLRDARNQAAEQTILNRALGKTYLSAIDPKLVTRTWQDVFNSYAADGKPSTVERKKRAFSGNAFDSLRNRVLVETTQEELMLTVKKMASFNNHIVRRAHNYALSMGWLHWPIIPPKLWPEPKRKENIRATTAQEHQKIMASEQDAERRQYYEFLWETGASQTDAATMQAENIDWSTRTLNYFRSKTGEACCLKIGPRLAELLMALPKCGFLFPKQAALTSKDRSAEFCRRCRVAGVTGVSLHSYWYAWAERAAECGYPERYAQQALGHASKAVHRAYARKANVAVPSLEQYQKKVVPVSFADTTNDENARLEGETAATR